MGAWETDSFGNDDAADWGGELADGGTAATVRSALDVAAETSAEEYLDSPDACVALAAAEVVAAAAGRPLPSDAYSEAPLAWASRHPEVGSAEFVTLALLAIDRIRAANSELLDLWLEAGEETAGEWSSSVADLRGRLSG